MTTTTLSSGSRTTTRLPVRPVGRGTAFATLSGRRFALSARTPREILVPLLTPILFALVIAPALATLIPSVGNGLDYQTYVATGTVGLLVPLSCFFAGIGVITDRISGAQRELLTAPVPRSTIVFGNLAVALVVSSLQLAALVLATLLRGAHVDTSPTGVAWFVAAAWLFAVVMYAVAETMANRIKTQEEYVGAAPAVAILPWFLAGSLFPISALPAWLTAVAKVLPLTHALALMRYGLLDRGGTGLREIWGLSDSTVMAAMSLGVVALYAAVFTTLAVRVFTRSTVR